MNELAYRLIRIPCRMIFFVALRVRQTGAEIPASDSPYILAANHQGNLDPYCISVLVQKPIHWMARKEYYKGRFIPWLLTMLGCISVNRQGIAISAIRKAIELAKQGRTVGIFPEGEVARGPGCAIRAGMMRKGVASIAIRSGKPVLPCVIVGTHEFNRVGPWLPIKSGRLYLAFGEPINPPEGKSTRAKRKAMTDSIAECWRALYFELQQKHGAEAVAIP